MTLEIKKNNTETTIKVVGRLDTVTAPVLEKMINQSALTNPNVVLELSRLEYISEVGLRVLLDVNEKMRSIGSLRLVGIGDGIMETLRATGCADALAIG